jgi:hypothetical protein
VTPITDLPEREDIGISCATCIQEYNSTDKNLYIVQYVLIYAGPPIYSAAEYNVLGRLLRYLYISIVCSYSSSPWLHWLRASLLQGTSKYATARANDTRACKTGSYFSDVV